MKKRFASFLLTGKIAAQPLLSPASIEAMQNMVSETSCFIKNQQTRLNLNRIMYLVITDLYDRDEVLIVASPEKDKAKLLEVNQILYTGFYESRIVNHFSVIDSLSAFKAGSFVGINTEDSASKNPLKAMSLPVDLTSLSDFAKDKEKVYLHVLVTPNSKSGKSFVRSSEALELKSLDTIKLLSFYGDVTEDCTPYNCY